ncbi:hypothetical protein KM031_15285 [Gemmobacter fulvus]|uniref:Uncharacterized protein n=1 Tax=Gemmobacter fulvus TaxID=2840474 RepID=A0A975S0I5_9RHOB|nr:hypothetical protein [Gemmobacter fulvus]MBT9247350.1 hypothetical protein [Gemmobacter fulvus]QWK90169.1 hypothetical protein KM031_15285 [Gemmobacter fulvus]
MRALPHSTIAQLLYVTDPYLNFARLVGEIDLHLARHCADGHRLSWDCEDVACFDIGSRRILISKAEPPPIGYAACLTMGCGPAPYARHAKTDPCMTGNPQKICALLVEGVLRHYYTDTVLWQNSTAPLDAELADALVEALPPRAEIERLTAGPRHAGPRHDPASRPRPAPEGAAVNDHPDLPTPDMAALHRVREALYIPDTSPPPPASQQLRLAAHAFNCTLMMVSLPVGAAVMTYSLLRGEDLTLSARALALTGTAIGLWQSGLGGQLGALI